MQQKKKKLYFPSYNKIKQAIRNKKQQQFHRKMSRMKYKIHKLENHLDVEKEHANIIGNLIRLKPTQDTEIKSLKECGQLQWETKNTEFTDKKESLNYYIDDDLEEENHYETHLKFKKKVLERDLKQRPSSIDRNANSEQEEKLYRTLYQNQRTPKENAKPKKDMYSSAVSKNKAGGSSRDTALYNKKYLNEYYYKYLRQLDHTHVVRWRILDKKPMALNRNKSINKSMNTSTVHPRKQPL